MKAYCRTPQKQNQDFVKGHNRNGTPLNITFIFFIAEKRALNFLLLQHFTFGLKELFVVI